MVGFFLGYIGLAKRIDADIAKYPEYTDWGAVYQPHLMILGLMLLLYIIGISHEKLEKKFGLDSLIPEAFMFFFVSIFFGGMFYAIFVL